MNLAEGERFPEPTYGVGPGEYSTPDEVHLAKKAIMWSRQMGQLGEAALDRLKVSRFCWVGMRLLRILVLCFSQILQFAGADQVYDPLLSDALGNEAFVRKHTFTFDNVTMRFHEPT